MNCVPVYRLVPYLGPNHLGNQISNRPRFNSSLLCCSNPAVRWLFALQAPAAGYEVFGPGQPPALCVNLELHRFAKSGVTVLQQRGAVLPGEERAFAADLVEWARESGFKV